MRIAGLLPIGDECMSRDQLQAICDMLEILAGLDTDRAKENNGVGFSRLDSDRGHKLANLVQSQGGLTRGQVLAAKAMLRKYRRQLDPDLYQMVYPNDAAA